MKVKLIPALLVLALLVSCGGETSYVPSPSPSEPPEYVMTHYRETNKDGKVMTERTYDSEGRILTEMRNGYSKARYEYDDEGRLICEFSGNTYVTEYEYDGDERVGKYYSFRPNGEKLLNREYHETYDEQGRLVEEKVYRGSGEWVYTMTYVYTSGKDFVCEEQYIDYAVESVAEQDGLFRMEKTVYDEQSRVIATESEHSLDIYGRGRTENFYDDAGNQIETRHYDQEDFCWRTENYTYDEQGRVLTYRQTYNGDRALRPNAGAPSLTADPRDTYSRGRDYTYGDDGLLTKMTLVDRYGNPENTTTYTYDSHGNCIYEENRSSDGDLLNVIEREFIKRGETE